MPPAMVFAVVLLLILVLATAHILASERASLEPCERLGGGAEGIMAHVVEWRP